jgi:hypothetical protein
VQKVKVAKTRTSLLDDFIGLGDMATPVSGPWGILLQKRPVVGSAFIGSDPGFLS